MSEPPSTHALSSAHLPSSSVGSGGLPRSSTTWSALDLGGDRVGALIGVMPEQNIGSRVGDNSRDGDGTTTGEDDLENPRGTAGLSWRQPGEPGGRESALEFSMAVAMASASSSCDRPDMLGDRPLVRYSRDFEGATWFSVYPE